MVTAYFVNWTVSFTVTENKVLTMDIDYPKLDANVDVFKRIIECEKLIDEHPSLLEGWKRSFETLKRLNKEEPVKMWLDFSPYSFIWAAGGFRGGLIFHGAHDGHGSGAGPAYSVTLTPTTGWQLHT